jgi:hypothetical protein
MKGSQLAVFTYLKPKPMASSTMATLMNTIVEAGRLLNTR